MNTQTRDGNRSFRHPENAMAGRDDLDVIGLSPGNLPGLFAERVRRSAAKTAYRSYDPNGERWLNHSWQSMADYAARFQVALQREGLQPGDRVAIRLHNCHHWVAFDQAALGLGLVVVPLYVADRGDNVGYVIEHSDSVCVLLGNHEQWLELRPHISNCQDLKRVILLEGDVGDNDQGLVTRLADWLPEDDDGSVTFRNVVIGGDSLASIVYTSGTTGRPKGVMLSHQNMLANVWSGLHSCAITPDDVFLSFLPLSHTLERTVGYYSPMMAGAETAYARSIPDLPDDLLNIKPTMLIAVPRIFERVHGRIMAQVEAGSPVRRKIFHAAAEIGWYRFKYRQQQLPWHPKLVLWPLLDKLVGAKVRARLGGRLKGAVVGGAALPPMVGKLFCSLGVELLQGYGLTESSPSLTINTREENVPSSIGLPLHGVELRIGEKDELMARGPNVMMGYWKNPEATAEVIRDGWLMTGDCARVDEQGFIYITGRIKEIIVLSTGEKVPPGDIESAIAEDPLFEQAMVIGEAKSFLSALVVLEPDEWKKLASELGLDAADESAVKAQSVRDLVVERIAKRMASFPGYARIYQATATLEPWSVENGLLTPTLKLKRAPIRSRFAADIDRMYEGH